MSAIKQFTRIGKHAMLGGATPVDRDVIPYGLVRSQRTTSIKGLNIIGLKRRKFDHETIREMLDGYRDIFENNDDSKTFAEKTTEVKRKYGNNSYIAEIVDFINAESKNPICTATSSDTD